MHVGNGHLSYNQHGELLASVATLLGRWWSFDYTLPTVRCTCAVRSGTHVCKTIYVGAERERGDITWYYACSGCIIRPDHRGFEDQAIRVCLFRFFFFAFQTNHHQAASSRSRTCNLRRHIPHIFYIRNICRSKVKILLKYVQNIVELSSFNIKMVKFLVPSVSWQLWTPFPFPVEQSAFG
jgi:hypothetical protein